MTPPANPKTPAQQHPEDQFHPRALAHLGDAVYELWIREEAIRQFSKSQDLHRYTTERVKAETQANLLAELLPSLSVEEQDLVRRAQNMPVPVSRRSNHAVYRQATAFEALIGYWHLILGVEEIQLKRQQVWELLSA